MDEKQKAEKQAITEAVAAKIRHYRRAKDLSQEDLALKAGINVAYFGQVERGLKCPTIDVLNRIAKALAVPLPELLRFDTTYNPNASDTQRLGALLGRIPADKLEQVYKIMEDIVGLYEN